MRKQTWLVDEFDPLSKMCHLPLHSQDRYLGRTGRRRFETKLFLEFCRNGHEKMYRNVCSTQIIMFIRLFLKKYIQLCNYVGHFAPQADRYHRGWVIQLVLVLTQATFPRGKNGCVLIWMLSPNQNWAEVPLVPTLQASLGKLSKCQIKITEGPSFTEATALKILCMRNMYLQYVIGDS